AGGAGVGEAGPGRGGAVRALVDARYRSAVWRMHRATPEEAEELVAYAASPLHVDAPSPEYPLPEPACVAVWERYAAEARGRGGAEVLRRVFVQLRFPVAAGTSQAAEYQAATRRGVLPPPERAGVAFACPEGLRIFLHPTPAGRVPVVQAQAREDFET